MSRIQLETSLPQQSIGANSAPQVRPMTLLESLTAPGVTPVYVDQEKSKAVSEFFFGITGGAAAAANQLAGVHDRKISEMEESNRKYIAEQAKRGGLGLPIDSKAGREAMDAFDLQDGLRTAKIVRDRVRQEMEEGKFNIAPGEDIGAAITRITTEESAGRSEMFQAAFNTAFREQAADLLISGQKRFREETYEKLSSVTPGAIDSSAQAGLLTSERFEQILAGADKQAQAFGVERAAMVQRAIMPAAEAIARRGDMASLGVMMETIRKADPAKAAQLHEVADAANRQNKADARTAGVNEMGAIEQDPTTSIESYKAAVESRRKTGVFTDYDAKRLTDGYTTKQMQLAVQSGNVDMIDAMKSHISADPDAQLAWQGARTQAVGVHRHLTAGIITSAVMRGEASPDDAIENLNWHLDAWQKDPNDQHGLPPDMYAQAVGTVMQAVRRIGEKQLRMTNLAASFKAGQEGTYQATPADDSAMILVWSTMGVAKAIDMGDSTPIFGGVVKPEAAARLAAGVQRVPEQWSQSMVDPMSNAVDDSKPLQLAMRGYAALSLRNPLLAAQVYKSLSPQGKARATVLMNEINREHSLWLNNDGKANKEWTARIAGLTQKVLAEGKPSVLTDAESQERLFGKDAKPAEFAPGELSKLLPEAMQRSKVIGIFTTQGMATSPEIEVSYAEAAREAFKAQPESIPIAKRIENAKAIAADQVLADHPPVTWNGVTYIGGNKGAPGVFTHEHEVEMLSDLAKALGSESKAMEAQETEAGTAGRYGGAFLLSLFNPVMGIPNLIGTGLIAKGLKDASVYRTEYRPEWMPNAGEAGAWGLRGGNGEFLIIDGKPFGFLPTEKQQATRAEREKQARERKALEQRINDRLQNFPGLQ